MGNKQPRLNSSDVVHTDQIPHRPVAVSSSLLSSSSRSTFTSNTTLTLDQCELLFKKVNQTYFGIPIILPTISDELFESMWGLDELLKETTPFMKNYLNEIQSLRTIMFGNSAHIFNPMAFMKEHLMQVDSNVLDGSDCSKLLIEWNVKLKEHEMRFVKQVPIWIVKARLGDLNQIKREGSFSVLTVPTIEFTKSEEASLTLLHSGDFSREILETVFDLLIMYMVCPLLVWKWVELTELPKIRDMFDNHDIGSIALYGCFELLTLKSLIYTFHLDQLDDNTLKMDRKSLDEYNYFGKDLITYYEMLQQLGQHGVGKEWTSIFRNMFNLWKNQMSSFFTRKQNPKDELDSSPEWISVGCGTSSAVYYLPRSFILSRCDYVKEMSQSPNEIKWNDLNNKQLENLISFWMTMELLDDSCLEQL